MLLDARVAEAAEAWLSDPQDVGVYARLVAAIEERRRHLGRTAEGGASSRPADGPSETASLAESRGDQKGGAQSADGRGLDAHRSDGTDGLRAAQLDVDVADDGPSERAAEPSWPAVRSVGADLVGDPAAVLRRLRGG